MVRVKLSQLNEVGVYPRAPQRRNDEYLYDLGGMRPSKQGIIPLEYGTYPFSTAITTSHSTPQLFLGRSETLLAYENYIYVVDTSVGMASCTGTAQSIVECGDLSTAFSPPDTGGPWHFADLGKGWWLFKDGCTIFKFPLPAVYGDAIATLRAQSSISINTGCAFNGRLIMGGFDADDYWSDEWKAVFEYWKMASPEGFALPEAPGQNYVSWSSVGAQDALFMFYPELALEGFLRSDAGKSIADPMFMEYLMRLDSGFMPMSFSGKVLCVKPLGDSVVVYGENGIDLLYPVTDPIPTMGRKKVSSLGITGRGAVGGNDKVHLFVDNEYNVKKFTSDGIQNLGYKYHFDRNATDIIVTYNDSEDEFWYKASNYDLSLVVTPYGATKSYYHPVSSVSLINDYVVVKDPADVEPYRWWSSPVMDFGTPKLKVLKSVELAWNSDSLYVFVVTATDSMGGTHSTNLIGLDDCGYVDCNIVGLEFRITIQVSADDTDFSFSDIYLEWEEL